MNMVRGTTLAFLYSLLCTFAWGLDPVVTVRGIAPSEPLSVGRRSVFKVELDIQETYHINAHRPSEDYLIPTSLELQPVPGLDLRGIRYPDAVEKQFSFSDRPLAVYEGTVEIIMEATPGPTLAGEKATLRGHVRYQACTDTACLPEVSRPFAIECSVSDTYPPEPSAPDPGLVSQDPARMQSSEPPGPYEYTGPLPGVSVPAGFQDRSLPVILALVFLGGLALNLTPCVYPMIPITITYFGGQAGGKRGSLLAHSCLYVAGMAVTYSLLGVAAALTGGLLGSVLQHPPVLVGISLVMVFLALSMFDVYELRMPAFINRMAGGSRRGFAGTVLMGMTVGIVAAPCIGPFVFGLLTYVGNRGNAVLGFALFFVLALGMGIPLLALGIFSGSIHRLPRSGEWLVWVRKVFGFILLAMAVFFSRTLFTHPLAYPMALALLLVLAGIYLAWIAPAGGAGKGFAWVRNLVGTGFFIAALAVAVAGTQSFMETMVGSAFRLQSAGEGPPAVESVRWLSFSEAILEAAAREGKPVLVDFYADWCAPCRELDRHAFAAPEVVRLSRRFVMVKVDLTSSDNPVGEALRTRYRVPGVPTILFLRSDGSEIQNLRVTGFEPADVLLLKMEEAYRTSAGQSSPAS